MHSIVGAIASYMHDKYYMYMYTLHSCIHAYIHAAFTVETGLNCGVQLVADSVVSITCDPDFTITTITCTLDGTSLSSCTL